MSLVAVLKDHVNRKPNQIVYTFLNQNQSTTLTFSQLDKSASNIAAELARSGAKRGDRAIIALSQGLDYLTVFWGCLYAGVIAVPVYPPINPRHLHRTMLIIQDAQAKIIFASSDTINKFKDNQDIQHQAVLTSVIYIDPASVDKNNVAIDCILPEPDDIAFLQYTSGSTGSPKGVIIKYKNIIANLQMMQTGFMMDESTRLISWVPLFHDMGLIGNGLQAVFLGAQLYFMTPLNFIRNPLFWLETISKYQGTHTFGPNFAYDQCIQEAQKLKVKDKILNLSSLKYLINGADTVRANTLTNFTEIFKEYGFAPHAWCPSYGMAEATLFITQGATKSGFTTEEVEAEALSHGKAILAKTSNVKTRTLVNHGQFHINQEVIIVDPETLLVKKPRNIGEIWVKGLHISEGYWNKPEVSKEIFAAYIKNTDNGPWLRTGDLGYLNEQGDLFLISRYKDLIILNGKNYAPQDFEATVIGCSDIIKHNSVIAFSVDEQQEEKLIIVAQLDDRINLEKSIELTRHIKKSLLSEHGVSAHEVFFLKRGTIPLTTSGKLQRRLCKQDYLAGKLVYLVIS